MTAQRLLRAASRPELNGGYQRSANRLAPPIALATRLRSLGDARRCDRGPRAYRSHHRLVAALDGVGTGGPNCRDNLGDIPVRGVHGDISSASASPTDEELRRNRGALVLLREWAWGLEPNEPAARLGRIGGALLAFSSGRHADHLPWC